MTVKEDEVEWLDPVSRWKQEAGTVYDLVSMSPHLVFQEFRFLPMEPEIAARIDSEIGLTVIGSLHIMDTDSTRHIIKNPGNENELLRGQSPLVREDFLLLPEVFGDPDTIEN